MVERNLLPALVPLAWRRPRSASPPTGARRLGARPRGPPLRLLARLRRLRHPDAQPAAARLPRPHRGARRARRPRAIVTWKLAADPVRSTTSMTLAARLQRHGPVREIDVVSKPVVARKPVGLPPGSARWNGRRLERLTLIRYVSAASPTGSLPCAARRCRPVSASTLSSSMARRRPRAKPMSAY